MDPDILAARSRLGVLKRWGGTLEEIRATQIALQLAHVKVAIRELLALDPDASELAPLREILAVAPEPHPHPLVDTRWQSIEDRRPFTVLSVHEGLCLVDYGKRFGVVTVERLQGERYERAR